MRSQFFVALALFCALASITGCEQKTTISGTVTYNGEPIESGAISFKPTGPTGRSYAGRIENGKYSVGDAQPGTWKAVIIGTKKIDFSLSSEEAARKASEVQASRSDMAGQVSELADYVPEDAEGNGKEVEVVSGAQTLDFAVKGPPRR